MTVVNYELASSIKDLTIGVDPGLTTGVCILQDNMPFMEDTDRKLALKAAQPRAYFDVFPNGSFTVPWHDAPALYDVFLVHRSRIKTIVLEDFVVYPDQAKAIGLIGSHMEASQVIGMVRLACYQLGIEPTLQLVPAKVKMRVKIEAAHLPKIVNAEHTRDAYKLAKFHLVSQYYQTT